jgi:hypothetical protein
MGSSLLLAFVQVPDDGSPPDWQAGHTAVEALSFTIDRSTDFGELLETLEDQDTLPAIPCEQADTEAMRAWEAEVTAVIQRRLHTRIDELREAHDEPIERMSRELSVTYLFGHRLLVAGGRSWGDPPSEVFEAINELADFPQVMHAMGCDLDEPR